jgi:acyl carrier protein
VTRPHSSDISFQRIIQRSKSLALSKRNRSEECEPPSYVDAVEEYIPLSSYGLDSLTSVRLSGILKSYFDISVT